MSQQTGVEAAGLDEKHWLNGCYGQWYDWRHGYEGHVFERRFWSALIETDWHLHESARYILLNPVRAGLCATAVDWKWSSYRKTMGMTTKGPPLSNMLLYEFGRRLQIARERYAAFIHAAE